MLPLWYVVMDFETSSMTDLKRVGSYVYARCPTTNVLTLSQCVIGPNYPGRAAHTWRPGFPIWDDWHKLFYKLDAWAVAHNVPFEREVYKVHMVERYGWPEIPEDRWHDTLAACAMKGLPQKLERAASVLGLRHQKDKEGNRLTLGLSRANKQGFYPQLTPEIHDRVAQYCEADVMGEVELLNAVGWLPAIERTGWLLDQKMNQRGLGIDIDYVNAGIKIVEEASKPLALEFKSIVGVNHTQRDKVMTWLLSQNVILPDMRAETLDALLGDDGDTDDNTLADDDAPDFTNIKLPKLVRRALHIRRLIGSSSVKKLYRMLECTWLDGRARYTVQWHGTGPGRGAGRLFQPQNFPRGVVAIKTVDKEGNEYTVAPEPEALVEAVMTGDWQYVECLFGCGAIDVVLSGLRHAVKARPGHVLISGDFAGIQARVVLAMAGQYDKVALMASGADVYLDMASKIHGEVITNKKDPRRHDGKGAVLGCGFQIGPGRFRTQFMPDKPEEFAETVVDVYRNEWAPEVPKLWKTLIDAATTCVRTRQPQKTKWVTYRIEDGWLTAEVPSGRKIWYRDPEYGIREMPWSTPEKPDFRPGFTFKALKNNQWRTIHAFGGLLTENAVMRIETDIKLHAIEVLEANGFEVVLEVHDEVVAEVAVEDVDAELFERCMLDVEDWVREMKIPVAVDKPWVAERYQK